MRFSAQRETLLTPLQQIIGVVERRQTKPVLGNVLLKLEQGTLTMTTSDTEIEMVATTNVDKASDGEITLPARKFIDICRALSEGTQIEFDLDRDSQRVTIRAAKSRFTLSTLPADQFPNIQEIKQGFRFNISQSGLRHLIERTQFSMAQQDVRYYLNGLLLEVDKGRISAVATDGHRLAYCEQLLDILVEAPMQVIVPRKGVMELGRLLEKDDTETEVVIGSNHIRITLPALTVTSKLVDGKFPDYQRVIPQNNNNIVKGDRQTLSQALARASILSNEKYRGIRVHLEPGLIKAQAHNPEMEEAEEEISVDYAGDTMEIGFNVNYLLEGLNAVETESVSMAFGNVDSSCLITPDDDKQSCKYVVMPMRL